MDKQIKKTIKINKSTVIAIISVLLNIFLVIECISLLNHEKVDEKQTINNDDNLEDTNDIEQIDENKIDVDETGGNNEPEKEYIYKYIEGKEIRVIEEKQVVVEKEVEVPSASTDATITYIDVTGNTKTIKIPSGTTISFSSGEHGKYNTVPTPVILTDNQELDITGSAYKPSSEELNYIFKGLSYSGDTMTCMYSLANNIINAECKLITNSVTKNNILYIKHEYIESTGTQYINTKYIPSFNTEVEVTYAYTDLSINYSPLFYSGYTYDSADTFGIAYAKVANRSIAYYGNVNNVSCGERSLNKKYVETYNKTSSKVLDTVTGTTSNYSVNATSFTKGTRELYILTGNTATTDLQGKTKAKIWSFKAKEGTELKLDLIPVEKLDGSIGMLNLINEEFLPVSGSGAFKHPEVVLNSGANVGKIMTSDSQESSSTLTITAVANDGYKFAKWSDGSTSDTRTITTGDSTAYIALFAQE